MDAADVTCWSLIDGASEGREDLREDFARRYAPLVRTYLASRWRLPPDHAEVEDATQDVLLECFRQGGVLDKAERGRPGGFRAFLYGVVRNVALRAERRGARRRSAPGSEALEPDDLSSDETTVSHAFDRAWARSIMKEAAALQEQRARESGEDAQRRVEILRQRFEEGLPVRAIADRLGEERTRVHAEYARARKEFRRALRDVVAFHHPGPAGHVEEECSRLIEVLR